jgi:hypothetical protein
MANDVANSNHYDKIPEILMRFNFQKVHEHMVRMDHKWFNGSTMEIPTIDELRKTARTLLMKAALDDSEVTNVGTGGFMAYKLPWGLSLVFQLEWA